MAGVRLYPQEQTQHLEIRHQTLLLLEVVVEAYNLPLVGTGVREEELAHHRVRRERQEVVIPQSHLRHKVTTEAMLLLLDLLLEQGAAAVRAKLEVTAHLVRGARVETAQRQQFLEPQLLMLVAGVVLEIMRERLLQVGQAVVDRAILQLHPHRVHQEL